MDGIFPVKPHSPWHEGELTIQRRAGVLDRMAAVGPHNIRHHLIQQHREFYPLLPFIVIGAVDLHGAAWATLLAGRPGFIASPDDKTLRIDARLDPSDPAAPGSEDGDAVGLLGMQLETRRRNRANGTIRRTSADRFDVAIEDSFGNCDRYIAIRQHSFAREPDVPFESRREDTDRLDQRARCMIEKADTLFVASYFDREDGRRQVDVSHRGGKAGFVDIDAGGTLSIPDFNGNGFFNTLGNILKNPRCGLLFVDFETGDMLQMTGEGSVVLDGPEATAFQGAERLWRFRPLHVVYRAGAFPLRFASDASGISPNVLLTGDWKQTAARAKAEQLKMTWRPFRVCHIQQESSSIRSLLLEPADGIARSPHLPGQYLPIRLTLPDQTQPLVRTYTLSSAPEDTLYRISVKADGLVSRHLHQLRVGEIIEARAPAGDFVLDAGGQRPIVLLAAGVGITPMVSMLRHLVHEGRRVRTARKAWLFYGARSREERAFDHELAELRTRSKASLQIVRALTTAVGEPGTDFEISGHLTLDALRRFLPFDDYDFYLCGPAPFMQSFYDGLRGMNIADDRIHFETFGPASVRRKHEMADDRYSIPVTFARSHKTISWTPVSGSLLELAESADLAPPFSCRSGSCGTCRSRILSGSVDYDRATIAEHDDEHALICCARPARNQASPLTLDL